MRKTKIVCTIGPASTDEGIITQMCLAGMNVARLNFSHGSFEEHLERIELVKKVRKKLNLPIAILLDTKGPEYRIKTFQDGKEMSFLLRPVILKAIIRGSLSTIKG